VLNLISFAVIAQIDDFYAMSLKNSFLRKITSMGQLNFSNLGKFDDLEINNVWYWKLWYIILYKVIKGLYDSVYYYFAPFFVLLVTFKRI
jgi:hypothetical protein